MSKLKELDKDTLDKLVKEVCCLIIDKMAEYIADENETVNTGQFFEIFELIRFALYDGAQKTAEIQEGGAIN